MDLLELLNRRAELDAAERLSSKQAVLLGLIPESIEDDEVPDVASNEEEEDGDEQPEECPDKALFLEDRSQKS